MKSGSGKRNLLLLAAIASLSTTMIMQTPVKAETLYDVINSTTGSAVRSYNVNQDENISGSLGTLGIPAGSDTSQVTLVGDAIHSIIGTGATGVSIPNGGTLIVNNIKEITGFYTKEQAGGFANVAADGKITITNTSFKNNSDNFTPPEQSVSVGIAQGAALYNAGKAEITGGSFISNTVSSSAEAGAAYGGAIYNTGNFDIYGTLFSGNTATSHRPFGGAIYSNNSSENKSTIQNATFKNNHALMYSSHRNEGGGAIYNNDGTIEITGSTFGGSEENEFNSSSNDGGAIYNNTDGKIVLNSSNFINNQSYYKGNAIYNKGELVVENGNIFKGGSLEYTGNLIYSDTDSTLKIGKDSNSLNTFSDSTYSSGNGMIRSLGALNLNGTLSFKDNNQDRLMYITGTNSGYSLSSNGVNNELSGLNIQNNNVSRAVYLEINNSTPKISLKDNSFKNNSQNSALVGTDVPSNNYGLIYVYGNGEVDVDASNTFEGNKNIYLITNVNGTVNLSKGFDINNSTNAETSNDAFILSSDTNGVINLTTDNETGKSLVAKNFNIKGYGAGLTLTGGTVNTDGIANTIKNAVFENNSASRAQYYNYYYGGEGGAVYLKGINNLTFDNVTFKDNIANSGYGGALAAYGSNIDIKNSLFDGNKNKSTYGSAIYYKGSYTNSNLSIADTTFTNNRRDGSDDIGYVVYANGYNKFDVSGETSFTQNTGGAIYASGFDEISIKGNDSEHKIQITNNTNSGISLSADKLTIDHVNIQGNTGATGVFYNNHQGSSVDNTINDLTIKGNTFTGTNTYGIDADFSSNNGELTISNSTIEDNTFGGTANGSAPIHMKGNNTKSSKLTLNNVTIQNNTWDLTKEGYKTSAGAVSAPNATLVINNSIIKDNTTNGSGAINSSSGTKNVEITDTSITGNTASNYGGGIYTYSPNIFVTAENSNVSISGNTAQDGGAIYTENGSATLYAKGKNLTVENNTATNANGVGIYVKNSLDLKADNSNVLKISDSISTSGLNINTDNNTGIVDLSGAITNSGAANIYGGTLKLSGNALTNKFNTFNVKGNSTIDLSNNGSAADNMKIGTLDNDYVNAPAKSNLTLIVDYDGTADSNGYGSMDKLTVDTAYNAKVLVGDGLHTRNVKLDLNNINILTDGDATKAVFLDGDGASNVTILNSEDAKEIASSGGYTYTFAHDTTTKGLLNISRVEHQYDLPALIAGEVIGIDQYAITTDGYKPFQIPKEGTADEYYTSLGTLTGENREFTISGGSATSMHSIDGTTMASAKGDGVTVGSGQTLNLRNISQFKNFTTAVDNAGTLNVENVVFTGNTTDINNTNELNLSGTNTINTITGATGNTNITGGTTTISENGSVTQNAVNMHGGRLVVNSSAEVNKVVASEGYHSAYSTETGDAKGGVIYNQGTITTLNGKFTGNSANVTNYNAYGGAIYNNSQLGTISADFISNSANGYKSYGGAIYNEGAITSIINSTFDNNSVTSENSNVEGGAIYNGSLHTIGNIGADFTNNSASGKGAYGGAIHNYSSKYGTTSIGAITKITNGFKGNSATTTSGNAYGGAIYNSSGYDPSSQEFPYPKAYISVGNLNTDFTQNHVEATGYAYGGAIYNASNPNPTYKNYSIVSIGNIDGNFSQNYAYSTGDEALGGAIYNRSASIGTINGKFTGNWAKTDSAKNASGGAIFVADGTFGNITADFEGNYTLSDSGQANGGAIYINDSPSNTVGSIKGNFTNNYAKSTSTTDGSQGAAGGAITNGKSESTTVSDLTILSDSSFTGNYVESFKVSDTKYGSLGGAITNAGGNLNIEGTTFSGNYAKGNNSVIACGGAIYNNLSSATTKTATITDSLFTGNYTTTVNNSSQGGAIYQNRGNLTISGTTFGGAEEGKGNYATSTSNNAQGGAIYQSSGNLSVTASNFISNSATSTNGNAYGGAIYNYFATITNLSADFTGNSATATSGNAKGGALYNEYRITTLSGEYSNNSVQANGIASGGAIYNAGFQIENLSGTFTGNYADGVGAYGGAIYNSGKIVTIDGATFKDNYVVASDGTQEGAAIYNSGNNSSSGKITTIQNSTFDHNTGAYAITNKGYAQITDITGNTFIDNTTGAIKNDNGYIQNITGNTFGTKVGDVIHGNKTAILNTNTGTIDNITGTFAYSTDSAIKNYHYAYADNVNTIGSINATFTNNSSENMGGAILNYSGYSSSSKTSEAIHAQITSLTGDFSTNSVTSADNRVYGGAIANIAGGAGYPKVSIGSISGKTTTGFNGNFVRATGSSNGAYGGAIANVDNLYSDYSKVEMGDINANFTGNSAQSNVRALGGAIYSNSTIGTITGDFTGNYVQAADARGGAIATLVYLEITDSSFSDNYVTGTDVSDGGAIYAEASLLITAATKDINFTGNKADNGAAIHQNASSESLMLYAQGGDIEFTNNNEKGDATGINVGIYSAGEFGLAAEEGQKITVNDRVQTDKGLHINYGLDDLVNPVGTVEFTNYILANGNNNSLVLRNGTIKLNAKAAEALNTDSFEYAFENLDLAGGTIDILNNNIDKIKPLAENGSNITGAINLMIDVDTTANTGDSFVSDIYDGNVGVGSVIISAIKIINDDADDARIQVGSGSVSQIMKLANEYVLSGGNYDITGEYDSKNSAYYLILTALGGYDDINSAVIATDKTDKKYSLKNQGELGGETVTGDLGNLVGHSLTVNGKNLFLDGDNKQGFVIGTYEEDETTKPQTLTLKNMTVKNFTTAVDNAGTLNVENVTFTGNTTADINNTAKLNLSGSNTINTITGATGNTYITGGTTTISENGSVTQNAVNMQGGNLTVNNNATLNKVVADEDYSISSSRVIYNKGKITEITGVFSGNESTNDAVAIYNSDGTIGTIVDNEFVGLAIDADFINNTSKNYGGAIRNYKYSGSGKIGNIKGDFVGNTVTGSGDYSGGGAIHNNGIIGDITARTELGFKGNKVQNASYEADGGAIYNQGTIGNISANFTENEVSGYKKVGAAIYNYSKSSGKATIGNITGNFTGNKGSAAIYNLVEKNTYNQNKAVIGNISGDFESNTGTAIVNEGNKNDGKNIYAEIGNITGTFASNHAAIYNKYGKIGDVTADFISNNSGFNDNTLENTQNSEIKSITAKTEAGFSYNNYSDTISSYSKRAALGNAGKIGEITSNFKYNIGGAITNSGQLGNITGDFLNNEGGNEIGAISNNGIIGTKNISGEFTGIAIKGDFKNNTAHYSNQAYVAGAAIHNDNAGLIGDIQGNFENNKGVDARDGARGGAIANMVRPYATEEYTPTIGNIVGNFKNNSLNFYHSDLLNKDISEESFGGAVYNGANAVIGDITGDFESNWVRGQIQDSSNHAVIDAAGGAIYNEGTIGTITGDFIGNYARRDGSATRSRGAYGGAIYTTKSLNLVDSNITGNYVVSGTEKDSPDLKGGAIYTTDGINITASTKNISVSENKGTEQGAAIYNTSENNAVVLNATGGNITFENNNLTGLSDGTGVGIYSLGGLTLNAADGKYIALNDALNITGNTTLNGTLKLGDYAVETLANTTNLIAQSGTLDIANGVIDAMDFTNAVDIQGAINLALDVDVTSTSILADYITASITDGNTSNISISNVNFMHDLEDDFSVDIATGTIGSLIKTATTVDITGTTSGYDIEYVFNNNVGTLNFSLITYDGINNAVIATDKANKKYALKTDEHVTGALGALVGTSLTVNGKGNTLYGTVANTDTKLGGFEIADGQTLTLKNMTVKNFTTAVDNAGTLNVEGVNFTNNTTADINNTGTLKLSGNNRIKTITGDAGTTNITGGTTVLQANGSLTQDKINFEGGRLFTQQNATVTANLVGDPTKSSTYYDPEGYAGGGVLDNVQCTILGTISGTFKGNSVSSPDSNNWGGVIKNSGTIGVYNSETGTFTGDAITADFIENSANSGGAIYDLAGKIGNFNGSTFRGNTATDGGAIFFGGTKVGTMSNVTFDGNTASSTTDNARGGAIYSEYATLGNISGNFTGNSATSSSGNAYGGAIYQNGGTLTISGSTFGGSEEGQGNTAASTANSKFAYGGAIYHYSNDALTLSDTIFEKNSVSSTGTYSSSGTPGAHGGAIFKENGTLTIVDTQFKDNSATAADSYTEGGANGGAIYLNNGTYSISGTKSGTGDNVTSTTIFENNKAINTGGASVSWNGQGAALYTNNSSGTIDQVVFKNNDANNGKGHGGAIRFGAGSHTVSKSVFIGNSGGYGSAIGNSNATSLAIQNSVFTGNYSSLDDGSVVSTAVLDEAAIVNITDSNFTDNTGTVIYQQGGKLNITDTDITGNTGNAIKLTDNFYAHKVDSVNVIDKISVVANIIAQNEDVNIDNNTGYGILANNPWGSENSSLTLYAKGSDITINGNTAGGINNNGLALTLNADTGHNITINDAVSSNVGMTVNDGGTHAGTVALNGALTLGGDTNIQGGTLKLGTGAATSNLKNVVFSNTSTLDLQNSSAQTTTVDSIKLNDLATANLNIDIDFTGTSVVADAINITTGGQTGVITLDKIAALNSDEDIRTFENLAILTGQTDGVTLAIASSLQTNERFYKEEVESTTRIVTDYVDNAEFGQFENDEFATTTYAHKTRKMLFLDDTATKLSYTDKETVPEYQKSQTTQDVLQALNQSTSDGRYLNATETNKNYTVGADLGTTRAGRIEVQGVASSNLNMNSKSGFELSNANTVLYLGQLNITGVKDIEGGLISITGENSYADLSGVTIADTTNSVILNNGTLNSCSTNNLGTGITGSGTMLVDLGKTTVGSVVQDSVAIDSALGELEVQNITTTNGITNNGKLTLTGNANANTISGTGHTTIAGNVNNTGAINQAITVNGSKTLTTAANLIGGTVTNGGKVELTGGALGQTITGGDITISATGDNVVTATVANLGGTITNSGNLLLSGLLNKAISGNTGVTKINENLAITTGSIAGTLDMNGGTLNLVNNTGTNYTMNKLQGSGNLAIDFDGTNFDSITVSDSLAGTITLTALNGFTKGQDAVSAKIILSGASNITLAISSALREAYDETIITPNNYDVDPISSAASWTQDLFKNRYYDISTGKQLMVDNSTTNKTLEYKYTVQNIYDSTKDVSQGDTLALVNKKVDTTRTFTTTDETATYNVGSVLGDTGAGKITVQGATDGTNTSTLNMAGNTGFVIGSDAEVELNTVRVTNTANSEGSLINNTAGTATLNNVEIASNSANVISSSGTLGVTDSTVNAGVNNNGTMNLNGTNQIASVEGSNGTANVQTGTTTVGSIFQKLINIVSDGKLASNGDVTATNGITNDTTNGLSVANGTLTGNVTGDGSTAVKGAVQITSGSTVSQQINITGDNSSLTANADSIGGAVNNAVANGLVLTGGTLAQAVTGDGSTKILAGSNVVENANGNTISQTVNVASGTLKIQAADILNNITSNTGTVELKETSNLSKSISGNTTVSGTVVNNGSLENANITGTLTTSADKVTGTITNAGTLNLSGTLDKAISGAGETVASSDLTLRNGASVAGILNTNGNAIIMSDDNAATQYNVGTLTGTGTLSVDVINNGGTIVSDSINAATYADGLSLQINNITGLDTVIDSLALSTTTGESTGFNLTVLDGYTGNGLTVASSITSGYTGAKNVNRSQTDELTQTASWTDHFGESTWQDQYNQTWNFTDGKVAYTVTKTGETEHIYAAGDTLQMLNTTTNFGTGERKFVTTDKNAIHNVSTDLGSTSAGTMTVQGATDGTNTSTLDMNGKTGFVVSNDNTILNLDTVNITGTVNSDGSLINNTHGTVNINNVTVANNANNVITNNNEMNLTGTNTINTGINGDNGTTNVKSGTSIIDKITQKVVEIFGGSKLKTETVTASEQVKNAGDLTITGASNSSKITGTGTTEFTNNVNNTGDISQGTVKVADGKTLTTTGDITTDTLTNGGTVTLNSADTTLTIKGGTAEAPTTVAGTINGTGTTVIEGNAQNNGTIESAVEIATSGKLSTNAYKVTGAINNGGNLDLTGGDIKNAISGDGNTTISGTVTNTTGSAIGNAVTVATTGNLTTAADKLGGAVENNGTTNGLTLTGGQLSQNVTGTGKTVIAGTDVSVKYGNSIAQDIKITSGNKLVNTNVSAIGGDVENNGDIQLYSQDNGKLEHNITGTGTTELNRDITVAANIDNTINIKSYTDGTGTHNANITVESGNNFGKAGQNITVDSNNSLTMQSASDIKGNLVDNGTVELQGGTISSAISGSGAVNITGNIINNAANTVTGAVSVAENAELAIGTSGDAFGTASSVTMGDGSKLNLQNGSADIVNDNLAVATDKTANIAMDWGDSIGNTTNINGKLNISDVDLTGTTSTTTPTSYAIATGSNIANVAIDENVNLKTNDTSFNQVKYNSTDGTFTGAKNNLAQAVNTTEAGDTAIYSMSGDEPAGALGAGTLDAGKLIVQGNGNTINGYGIIVGDGSTTKADLTIKDASMKNISGDALVVNGNDVVTLVAENSDIEISGTTGNAITLNKDTNGNSTVNINGGSHTVTIENDIISDDSGNTVKFNSGTVNFNGKFDPAMGVVGGATVNRGGDDDGIDWTVTSGTLNYLQDSYLNRATNTMDLNGGTLNTVNGVVTDFALGGFTLSNDSNFYADVDLAAGKMDNFISTPTTYTAGTLHVAGLNLISDATADNTSIPFANSTLAGHVDYTGGQGLTALSPIYKYNVGYNSSNGNFDFARYNSGGYDGLNPAIMAAPVAAQMGGYLTQLNSYDEAFRNMDMYMLMTAQQRQALKNKNKIASLDGGVLYDATLMRQERAEGWFRPFATFEKVGLRNGPKVENIAYGSYMGGESQMYDLGHGWDGMWGAYVGYNGSHQNYDGVSIYQNGGTLGVLGMAYKGNFFTGLTINAGASGVEASTMYGNEDFAMLMAGIASKTGYNWELFNGKFIIQPSMLMSYSFVNTFDYRNAAGVKVDSDPLHAIQLQPEIKFIGNLKNGWQPYASVAMVWNIMDDTKFKANDVSLPELSVKPYVKYGVGVRKTWGERLTGFFQTYLTNGGRNGVGLQAGFTWAFGGGKNKKADEKKIQKSLNKTPELKKTEIVLNGKKVQ